MNDRKLMDWLGSAFTGEGGSLKKLPPPDGLDGEAAELALRIYSECKKLDTYDNYSRIYMQALNSMEKYYEMSIRALSAMIKIGGAGAGVSDIDALCRHTLEIFSRELEFENCSIMLLDEAGEGLELVAGRGKGDRYAGGGDRKKGIKMKLGSGIAGQVALTGAYICISDVSADPRFSNYNSGVDVSSLLCVPIKSDEKIIGVLNFSHPLVEAFDKNTINLMLLLSNFVGQMITLATLHNEIAAWNEKLRAEVDRKTLELSEKNRELNRLNRDLEDRVRAGVEKLRQQEQMLVQQSKMAAIGDMLGVIAHQWTQPLTALSLQVQDIMDTYIHGELDEAFIASTVATAMDKIGFMHETIQHFRNFFVPDKEKALFDAALAVNDVLKILSALLRHNYIATVISCACDSDSAGLENSPPPRGNSLTMVSGYPNEFKQVLLNLITNARDSILERRRRDGSGTNEKGRIGIDISAGGGKIKIAVSDNGAGIPPDILDRIFDSYFTTKLPGEGTGIGLYMSKAIIENSLDGTIYAENTAEGARFVMEIGAAKLGPAAA
jgi:signal transduction histidine kinase